MCPRSYVSTPRATARRAVRALEGLGQLVAQGVPGGGDVGRLVPADDLDRHLRGHGGLDALGDVLFLKLLLSKLREAVERQFPGMNAVEKMVELTKEPVFITKPMRFGKHKGKTIQELAHEDAGYLRWMMENMQNLDEDVRYTIRKVLEG